MENARTLFHKFFRRMQAGMVFWNFVPGIGITNTTPVRPNFESLFAFWNLSQKKNNPGKTISYRYHTHPFL
jgi:hypothetical protein